MRNLFSLLPCMLVFACAPLEPVAGLDDYGRHDGEVAMPGARITGEGVVAIDLADGATYDVPYVIQEGLAVAGGDMILGTAAEVTQRTASVLDGDIWYSCEIAYKLDENLPSTSRMDFLDAVDHWEEHTNLRFVEDPDAMDLVHVTDGPGCSSTVGQRGGSQNLTLSANCGYGAAIHEIGHAMGLWHEQNRADADDHVVKHWDNIKDDKVDNFQSYTQRGRPSRDLGAYDFSSVMHYPSGAFTKEDLTCTPDDTSGCTLTHLDGSFISEVQRAGLSDGDIASIAAMYAHCDAPAPTDDDGADTDDGDSGQAPPTPPAPSTGDDHGDTNDTATEMLFADHGMNAVNAHLHGHDVDVFRVEVFVTGQLTAYTLGTMDTMGTLYSANGERLANNDDTSGSNFEVGAELEPGTYFLHVSNFHPTDGGSYDLIVQIF